MKTSIRKISASAAVLALAVGFVACGGGGGGDSSPGGDLTIEGSVTNEAATARTLGAGEGGMAGVQVSALGSTATTDELGNFTLSADGTSFSGGEVQFSFLGAGIDTSVVLDGIQGGPGSMTLTAFALQRSGRVSGEATDLEGNVLGRTAGGNLGCDNVGTYIDGGLGFLWKPHSESTGTPAALTPPNYQDASIAIFNVNGDQVDSPVRRSCCDHNGGRDHAWFSRSASSLAAAGVPLTVRYEFPNGFVDCRTVDNPTLRYD